MNEPTNKTLFVTMLILGGIIILILLVPRSVGGNYAYNGGLSASATPFYSNSVPQQTNLDFGGYNTYQPDTYTNTTPKTTTTTYTYSYPEQRTTQYPTNYDYNNYYTNDYLYPNNYNYNNGYSYPNNYYNYNQYQSPTSSPNYNSAYPGGCNPGYTYSVINGQLCRGVY